MAPPEVFSWGSLLTIKGIVVIVVGGFLVGFGTAYAGGCTSGHAITGLADLAVAVTPRRLWLLRGRPRGNLSAASDTPGVTA